MWYNPIILTGVDLSTASVEELLRGIYSVLVASTMLWFALVIFYFVFKVIVWFLPKFWHRSSDS